MRKAFDTTRIVPDEHQLPLSQTIVDYLFDFKGPKFLFDDIYHFSIRHYARHANNRNMLPVVKLMLSSVINHTVGQNSDLLFVPEAITNGKLYYDLAEKHQKRIRDVRGHLTTYRMGEILNKGELNALTEKNKNRAMTRLEGFQKLYPDTMAVSPTGMEAMLKCLNSEPGFSNYQMLRDEDFEAFWIGVCLAAQKGGFSDEVAYSRNGNFETFALFQVKYGLIPFRPDADMDIVFPNKKSVTPHDYLQMLFSHLLDVVPRGFTSDLSVKMAMRMIMLEDMRTKGLVHPVWSGLDRERLNPQLAGLSPSHDKSFKALAADFLSFMREHKLGSNLEDMHGLKGYDVLREFYNEKVLDLAPTVAVSLGYREKIVEKNRQNLDMDSVLQKKGLVSPINFQIPYQLDGDFFSNTPKIFSQDNFKKCELVEQLALRTFMGLIETPKPPIKEKMADKGGIMLLIDRRGGEAASEYAAEFGCLIPSEARGLTGSFQQANFEETVKTENIIKTLIHADILRESYPRSRVTTLEDIEEDCENFRRNRNAFVAPGSGRFSAEGKAAYAEEILRRSIRLAVFDHGWENSAILTGLRMHARKIQMGLVERPAHMPEYSMMIGDMVENAVGYKPASLVEDLKSLYNYADALRDAGIEEPPRYLIKGLLETLLLVRLYYSEEANIRANPHDGHGVIDWQSVPMVCKAALEAQKDSVITLSQKVKSLLLDYGMNALSLNDVNGEIERIDPDYISARRQLDAEQRIAKASPPRTGAYQKIQGYNAA